MLGNKDFKSTEPLFLFSAHCLTYLIEVTLLSWEKVGGYENSLLLWQLEFSRFSR